LEQRLGDFTELPRREQVLSVLVREKDWLLVTHGKEAVNNEKKKRGGSCLEIRSWLF